MNTFYSVLLCCIFFPFTSGKFNSPFKSVSVICPGPVGTNFSGNMAVVDDSENDPETAAVRKQYLKNLTEFIGKNIQTPEEVAAVIKEAVQAERPHFRYFTSEVDLENAKKKFSDLTGDSTVQMAQDIFFKGVKVGQS